eukprot:2682241-Prorocentrum_lima.AAC.1
MQSSGAGVSACAKWRMSRNWLCALRAAARTRLGLGHMEEANESAAQTSGSTPPAGPMEIRSCTIGDRVTQMFGQCHDETDPQMKRGADYGAEESRMPRGACPDWLCARRAPADPSL